MDDDEQLSSETAVENIPHHASVERVVGMFEVFLNVGLSNVLNLTNSSS